MLVFDQFSKNTVKNKLKQNFANQIEERNNYSITMNNQQEYELRIGVIHHPSLKTQQLRNFLNNQSNDFLANQLPQSLMVRQIFTSSFEHVQQNDQIDLNEFVGLILLYSASSSQSFIFIKQFLQVATSLQNTFKLLVEMDNSQKQLNVVGTEGQQIANHFGLVFVRLNLYNSDQLVNNINRNIYIMIENYYYPNEEERQRPTSNFEVQASPSEFILDYNENQRKIIATSNEKEKVMDLIEKAGISRTSREKQILAEQQAIDQSIENVQKVLNNINRHIKSKLDSNWFTSLKDSLYKPVEKQSKLFSKIKLTQEFIDEDTPKSQKKSRYFPSLKFKESIHHSKYNYTLQQSLKKLDSSLFKIAVIFDHNQAEAGSTMVQLQVFQNSTYEELALNALRKLGLRESERNHNIMIQKVKQKIQTYIRQLSRKVKQLQRQRTFQRSYIAVSKK